ncbi:transmembrane protein KIAA1109 homolog tweek [Amblyomma americanum]
MNATDTPTVPADVPEVAAAYPAAWNTTAPLEKLPLDSNFAWLLCALLAATAWVIYITYYNARVLGFLLTKVLNRFVGKAYLKIGSVSLSVLSGKLMFRDVAYVTPDYTVRAQDGWLIFRWWIPYVKKEFPRTCADAEARVFVLLNGLEMHIYNRSQLYSHLEQLFGLEPSVLPNGPDQPMPEEPPPSNAAEDHPWRDLVPVLKVEVSTGRLVFGNRLLPTTISIRFEEAHATYKTRAAASRLDLFQHTLDCRLDSFKVMLAPSPKYIGVPDEPPRFMGEGFVVLQSNRVHLFYYQDEAGLVPAEQEVVQLANGDLVERRSAPTWGLDAKCGRGTSFSYGPWADRQRDKLMQFFFPQDYQPLKPTPQPQVGERRRAQSFDLRLSTTADATLDLLFSKEKETNAVHMTVKQGSYLELTLPWQVTDEGYTTRVTGQLFHLEASTSLPFRNLLESEILGFDVQGKYPLIWNGHQDWQCSLAGCRSSLTLLHTHKGFFQALIEDWASKARPDLLRFVPYTWHLNLVLTEFELITLANEYNWVDCAHQENARVAFCGEVFDLSFDLPFVDFLPPQLSLKFWIQAESVSMLASLPEGDPHRELLLLLDRSALVTDRMGAPRTQPPPDKKWHFVAQPSKGWVEVVSVPIVALSLQYTYHPVPPLDFAHPLDFDVTTPEKEELLLSPIRPPKKRAVLVAPDDFDPGSMTPDVLSLELEIGPSVLSLDGVVLHLLMQLKENYLGAWQDYVDMEADAPPPEKAPEGDFDPRCFRPLDVRATLIMHDMQGHLMKGCSDREPPCPSLYLERLQLEICKSHRESQLQLLLSPLVAVCPGDRPGHLALSSFQVRAQALFSGAERPLCSETLEYAWLVELQAGDITGRLTLPQLYDLVVGAELFVQQAQHSSGALVPPQGRIHCQHDLPQIECSHAESSSPCPVPDDLKYRMIRFMLDYVDICLEEANSAIAFEVGPLKLTQCNLHSEQTSSGLSLQLRAVNVVQFLSCPDGPWLQTGKLEFGPLVMDNWTHGLPQNSQEGFLRTHDKATHRLWFLWGDSRAGGRCGCLGGCFFFGSEDAPDGSPAGDAGQGEEYGEPRHSVFRQYSSPAHRQPAAVSFARSASACDGPDTRSRETPATDDLADRRRSNGSAVRRAVSTDSTHSSEAFFSADEDGVAAGRFQEDGDQNSDKRRRSFCVRGSSSASSSLDRRRHAKEQDPDADSNSVSSTSFLSAVSSQEDVTLVNLHHQMDRPIAESPLLMACYAAHLSQYQVTNWEEVVAPLPHLVARSSDGGPPSASCFLHASSCWKPRFTPWGTRGFSDVRMVARARRAASIGAAGCGSAQASKSAASTEHQWAQQPQPSSRSAVVVRLQGDVHLLVSPPLLEGVRGFAEALTPTLAALHPTTVLGRLLARCWTAVKGSTPQGHQPQGQQPCPAEGYHETHTEQVQLWLHVPRVNVMALQCSVVEELIAFSALDNLKDLACVSVLALCLDQVQVQMLQSQQAQRCVQVLPDAQEQSPPLGRRPEKPLLFETSLPGHHQGVATISLGAAHAQLRRLRNCSSSLLKEATVTCVAPHHSKVCFTFECPDWEKVREDEKMGFIMTECGLEGASLRLVGQGGPRSNPEESGLSFHSEGEPSCDALLLLEIKTVWFNFAAPPRTTNTHRTDFTRLDWHLLSTMTPSINAWLKPCDRLLVALRKAQQTEQQRLCAVLAWLMAEAMDAQGGHLPPRGKQLYGKLTPLARALQEEPSCQLLSALCRFLPDAPAPEESLGAQNVPPLGTLRRGLLALSRQWKHLLYMPLLVEQNSRLRKCIRPEPAPLLRVPLREDDEPQQPDETACLLAEDAGVTQAAREAKASRPGAFPLLGAPLDSPLHYGGMLYLGKTLEHGISCMVANSGRLRGSRHSLATWSFSSVEPILRSSLDPANDDEDLYNWMARQRGPSSPMDSPSSRSAPRDSGVPTGGIPDAQTVFEPLLEALGACALGLQTPGPRLALSALTELLRVDLVESESPDQPQRRRSKPGQRLFVDTSTDTPALVCDRLTLELDMRHPGSPGTCAHIAVDMQYVAQQVNMPLLRLLHQFSSMYENVKETRLELQCRRPRADSAVVQQPGLGGSQESVAVARPPEAGGEGTATPRCWKTMCFLLDLYETMPPSQALADRFTISVGEHKLDVSEGYRGNGKYEHLHEHRVDMENGDAQGRQQQHHHQRQQHQHQQQERPSHREMPRPAATASERVSLAVFAMGHVKRIRLLAMLSGLRLEAELSGLQASGTHKETLRDGGHQSESSATGRLGPASVVLLEGQPPNHQMVVTMAVGTSQALASSRGWGPTARHAALISVGAVHIDIPQHPVVLHSMVTRSSKQLSTTLQELRRSAPGRTTQRPPVEETTLGSPMLPAVNPRPAPPVVRLDLVLEGLTTGAALLPSLRAHYHMGPLTGTGCTGAQARFTVHLPQHSLSFNTKVPPACEANLPSRASVELPPVQVAAEYLQDPGGPSQRDADGVVLRRGSYLSALAEIGTFEHSLTTDLLNHLVLVQKVFMKEVNEVVQKMSGTRPLRLWEGAPGGGTLGSGGQLLFSLQLRLKGIRLTATTPTASAVRLQTGTLDLQLSNRVQNASRAVTAMKLFGKGQVDLSLALGQLVKNTLFEEAEFQQFAFFKTRICLRNALQDEMISSQYDDKEAVLITMNRPMIYFQPIALDKAVLVWLNYKNAYEYWNEQRGSLNKEVLTATQQLFERVPQFPQLSSQALGTLFLQLTVQDLGICMPLNKGTLTNSRLFDADATPAVVVTLENTRISACSCGSLVSKARFTGLCLRFADEFEVSMEDWKPDPNDATTTNLCVVSEGTYEICSRTIAAQAGSNAKWILNVQWQMEGVDIHVDVGISKALSALFRTLTALTGEGDEGESPEEQARAAQEPVTLRHACLLLDPSLDAKKRSRLIEKEMNEQAKIISDLRFLGASQSTIEQEERRLKELETAVFNDFRRDVIKKLRRQSVKAASIKDKLGLGTMSRLPADTPEEEARVANHLEHATPPSSGGMPVSPTKEGVGTGTHTRTASFDMSDLPATPRRPISLVHRELSLDSVFSQTTASVTNSGAPTPTSEPSEPALSPRDDILPPPVAEVRAGHTTPVPTKQQQVEPSIDFELDIKVFFNSGKCVLHTRDPAHEEEPIKMTRPMRKERSFSGGLGLPDGGSPTRRRSGPRSHPSSSRMRFPPAATATPGQVTDFTVFLVPGLDVKVHYNSWTVGGESPVGLDPPARRGGTKKATLFAWITLQSIPEETVISPHILDFLEQALEAIPLQQAAKASPVASVDGGGGLVLEESQYGSFPVDVIVYFRMQPSILRFSCLPVSRVECLLRLPSVDLAFSSKRADEGPVGGLSATGCLADFSLYIFHPYGGAKKMAAAATADASPLAVTERKDSLSLQVEFVKVNMSRSRHIGADNGRALIRFSALCDVGSASFKYDMRRLTEILAFPKAWYRRSIARRMFLGDPATAGSAFGDQAEDSAETSSSSGTLSPSRADSFPFGSLELGSPEEEAAPSPQERPAPPRGQAWETLLLYALNLSRLNVHMNMGNVMGNTSWLTQGFRSQGRLAIDSRGHKDLNLAVDLDGSSLDAKGGIVGGAIELSRIHTHMGLQESWGREPVHTLTLALWAAESRLDYMGSSVLMGRVSQLAVELRDEWRLCEGCEATKRPALLFVHGQVHWDQLQLLISKSTTPDLAKMGAKLEEFFSQQFHSSRRVFSSMRLAGPRPRGGAGGGRGGRMGGGPDESRHAHQRHWQGALALVSGLQLGWGLRLPLHGTLVGGSMDLRGGNVSLACFHGVSFRSKAWALFSLRQPSIHFATEAQDVLGPQAAVDTHVVQHLTFRLGHAAGSSGNTGSMATVCRISRNVLFPPQFKSVSEWFQYAFASSELDDVGRFPVFEGRPTPQRPPETGHTMEMIFAFPSLELHLKTEQLQGEHSPGPDDSRPVVECSFVTEFDDHIFVAVDAEAFFFLHNLIVSYIREKDGGAAATKSQSPESERRKRSIAESLESLHRDFRDYQCYTWHLEPTVRLLSWAGKGIEPYGVDYILHKLGFSHARVTIPKWLQRGCMDPLDLFLSLMLERMLKAVRQR